MGFEQLQHLYNLHQGIAEYEAACNKEEEIVRVHLERAMECCFKSMTVKAHKLNHPLLYDWPVSDAPSDNLINVRFMKDSLAKDVYAEYRDCGWFIALQKKIEDLLAK